MIKIIINVPFMIVSSKVRDGKSRNLKKIKKVIIINKKKKDLFFNTVNKIKLDNILSSRKKII